jgi:hypothetical protein
LQTRPRIVKDKIRLLKDGIRDAVMETCCGLPNFRLQYRPWHYALSYILKVSIDGQPRTSRRYSTYDTSPLPTMADKLLFILTYLIQNPSPEVPGQLFGRSQANAHKWLHLLHTVLNQALAQQELLPARTADELATLLATKQSQDVPPPPFLA